MEYNGYRSIKEYESECARIGYTTRRVPFRKGYEKYFALITAPPGHPTGTSVQCWTLFTADEKAQVLQGITGSGTPDLSAHGYYPEIPDSSPTETAPALEIVEDGSVFPQLSLLAL